METENTVQELTTLARAEITIEIGGVPVRVLDE
jgi:hypothetical protein